MALFVAPRSSRSRAAAAPRSATNSFCSFLASFYSMCRCINITSTSRPSLFPLTSRDCMSSPVHGSTTKTAETLLPKTLQPCGNKLKTNLFLTKKLSFLITFTYNTPYCYKKCEQLPQHARVMELNLVKIFPTVIKFDLLKRGRERGKKSGNYFSFKA